MIHAVAKAPPSPHIVKMRWTIAMIWLIPLAAIGIAGYYVHTYVQDHGTSITVKFSDGSGLKPGQTIVTHLGVQIGQVEAIDLSADQLQVLVRIRLLRDADAFSKKGALFWIIRPELTMSNISGLGTIVSGPIIDSSPGAGDQTVEFTGLDTAPAALGPGLTLLLHATRFEQLQPHSPIYYRGFQVGVVRNIQLSDDATGVTIQAFIYRRYISLVRSNSRFWFVSGLDIEGGILTGIQVKLDSLRSLLTGGIAFATPEDNIGEPVADGTEFLLAAEPKPEWTNWSPQIMLPPADPSQPENQTTPAKHTVSSVLRAQVNSAE